VSIDFMFYLNHRYNNNIFFKQIDPDLIFIVFKNHCLIFKVTIQIKLKLNILVYENFCQNKNIIIYYRKGSDYLLFICALSIHFCYMF
jgi:hypothetical protein